MRLLGVVVATCALWPAGGVCDTSAAATSANTIAEIRFETTPGKPMQLARQGEPAEKIVARRDGSRITLVVSRNVGTRFEEGRAELSERDWRRLIDVIAAHSLSRWKARRTGQPADDFSTTAFALLGAGGKSLNEQQWSQPTEHTEEPGALAQALGELAKAKVAKPALYYF